MRVEIELDGGRETESAAVTGKHRFRLGICFEGQPGHPLHIVYATGLTNTTTNTTTTTMPIDLIF
jgi:hypothetical protein